MNWIKELKMDKAVADLTIDRYKSGLQDIAGYLCSAKYHGDTKVERKDILLRLAEVNSHAGNVQYSDVIMIGCIS